MSPRNKLKMFLLFVGDIIVLYISLIFALLLRYGADFYSEFAGKHFLPFTIIFIPWLIIFYIAGLYDLRRLRNNLDFLKTLSLTLAINFMIAVLFFYLIAAFGITPKTNLFIFIGVFLAVEILWRHFFNQEISLALAPNKIFLVGNGKTIDTIYEAIRKNPQLDYEVTRRIDEDVAGSDPEALTKAVIQSKADIVIVPHRMKQDNKFAAALYKLLSGKIEVFDSIAFYELLFKKIPLSDIDESWFLENIAKRDPIYEFFKRALDVFFALVFLAVTVIFLPLIWIIIKIESPGPGIFTQTRVGKNGRLFWHYKFRSMKMTDKNYWPTRNDERITRFGKFLRRTHLDEIPQFVNVLKNDLSLVGPRPDLVDFFHILEKELPYYTIRTLVKPGLSGWAQVNNIVTATLEENNDRLAYDLYYLKNRSLLLDFIIVLKTIKIMATAAGV